MNFPQWPEIISVVGCPTYLISDIKSCRKCEGMRSIAQYGKYGRCTLKIFGLVIGSTPEWFTTKTTEQDMFAKAWKFATLSSYSSTDHDHGTHKNSLDNKKLSKERSAKNFLFAGPSERNLYWGTETSCKRSEQKRGSGGLPLAKCFMTTPFRLSESALSLEIAPLREAKIMTNGNLFRILTILNFRLLWHQKILHFWYRYW